MNELLNKISSYNLFNYLFPGVLFIALLEKFTEYSLLDFDAAILVFISYFIGLIASRFGSLVVEPLLKKLKIVEFAKYSDYIAASKEDPLIETLSEVNNMYRTLIAMFIILLGVKIYEILPTCLHLGDYDLYVAICLLLGLLVVSYRKQTSYITRRIKQITNS